MRRIAASSVAPIALLSALPASLRCTRLSRPLAERHSGSASRTSAPEDESPVERTEPGSDRDHGSEPGLGEVRTVALDDRRDAEPRRCADGDEYRASRFALQRRPPCLEPRLD